MLSGNHEVHQRELGCLVVALKFHVDSICMLRRKIRDEYDKNSKTCRSQKVIEPVIVFKKHLITI